MKALRQIGQQDRLKHASKPEGEDVRNLARRYRHVPEKHTPESVIRRMVRRIAREFHPQQIILFGSHARGDAAVDSDVDFLVVMPVTDTKARQEVRIGVALHGFRVPKDIIVSTPEEFAWRKDVVGTIEYPAAHEGKLLYARQ